MEIGRIAFLVLFSWHKSHKNEIDTIEFGCSSESCREKDKGYYRTEKQLAVADLLKTKLKEYSMILNGCPLQLNNSKIL